MYHNPRAVVQVNGKRSDRAVSPTGLPTVSSSPCPRFGAPTPEGHRWNPAWHSFGWSSFAKGISVRRWYQCLCIPRFRHKGCEEGGCEVQAVCRGRNQLWSERGYAAKCLEWWLSNAGAFPLEWRTYPHPRSVVHVPAPTRAKLVGSTGQSRCPCGYLLSDAVFLKGTAHVCCVHLPLDPCASFLVSWWEACGVSSDPSCS